MDESSAEQVTEALRAQNVMAHVASTGLYRFGIRVVIGDGREALWDADGTAGIEAQILRDGMLTGFIPKAEGSEDWGVHEIVAAIRRADYDTPDTNATGSVGVQDRAPIGQRGGLRETRPRAGGSTAPSSAVDRLRRRLRRG